MRTSRPVSRSAKRIPRRTFGAMSIAASALSVLLAFALAPHFLRAAQPQATIAAGYLVFVGTYTSTGSKPTGSKGIYVYRFDAATGETRPLGLAAESDQPSFLAVDPSQKFLYAVNETDTYQGKPSGGVSAFSIDHTTAKLTFLNEVPSRGGSPAHVAVDRTGKYVAVSNYDGGSLAIFPILEDGKLGDDTFFVQHEGSSVNKKRQASPHVHEAIFSPDNRFLLSTDLGLDELFVYPFDAQHGTLGAPRVISLSPGSGPRHIAFSPGGKFVFLVSEMGSTITVLPYDPANGNLAPRQTVRLAPSTDRPPEKAGAEIAVSPSGRFVYASNRFDNLIGVFSTDSDSGMLAPVETVPLDGKTPRNFAIDPTGTWLWDANQDSDNIVMYRLDQQRGRLQPSGLMLKIPAPTCVLFVPAP